MRKKPGTPKLSDGTENQVVILAFMQNAFASSLKRLREDVERAAGRTTSKPRRVSASYSRFMLVSYTDRSLVSSTTLPQPAARWKTGNCGWLRG